MKYFSLSQIQEALENLRSHHVVFGITFLVLKKARVHIGSKTRFSLDAANHKFLADHYRLHPKSAYFFRVLRQGNPKKDWVDKAYAAKGLQSVNTRGCPGVFLHDRNDNTWGWSNGYIEALANKLPRRIKLPLFHLAVWLYKDQAWKNNITRTEIVKELIEEYFITPEEIETLFQTDIISRLSEAEAFQEVPLKWHQILAGYSSPKDVPPEHSGILSYLETESVGPINQLSFSPARRLNIITGDNGLGKTFLLDLAWWALTQDWADRPALPTESRQHQSPTIKFVVSGRSEGRPVKARFSNKTFQWEIKVKLPTISGLVIYARVDGSFAVWDPINSVFSNPTLGGGWPGVKFSREEVWNGKPNQIDGLISDWVRWQERPDKYPAFDTFKAVLKRVSPPDLGVLLPGEPIRLHGMVKKIPTLVHPYGTVPILYASAGIKRIVTLAYLIVWAWEEHKAQARLLGKQEERQMVVILDEAEAHLHPKWQRVILPALLGIAGDLHAELSLQLLIATHSPLVIASSEPVFDPQEDKLFHIDMSSAGKVAFNEVPFEVRGSVDSWLSSPLFELSQPGSPEREDAIKEAIQLQKTKDVSKKDVEAVTEKLRNFLASEDPFWVRWVFFAEKHNVSV